MTQDKSDEQIFMTFLSLAIIKMLFQESGNVEKVSLCVLDSYKINVLIPGDLLLIPLSATFWLLMLQ